MEKSNKNVFIIIIGCLLLVCVVAGIIGITSKKTKTNNDNEEVEEKVEFNRYGIIGINGVDPFTNLDFSNKATSGDEDANITLKDNKLLFTKDIDFVDKEIKTKENDIISIGLITTCNGPSSIVYLTKSNKLYEFPDFHQEGFPEEGSDVLIASNVSSFTLFDDSEYEYTTCGGQSILFKEVGSNEVYESIAKGDSVDNLVYDKVSINQLKYKYVAGEEKYIYVIDNENIPEFEIVKNDQGSQVKAQEVYTGYITDEEENEYIIIVDENNNMYMLKSNEKAQNIKVTENIKKESEDKFSFVNTNGETKTLEVQKVY